MEDIALTFAIPLSTLKNWARTQAWAKLAADYQPVALVPAERAERDMARIEANREAWARVYLQLQLDAAKLVDDLLAGRLRFKKPMSTGELVEVEPNVRDRVDIAAYVGKVAEGSYRALGDAATPAGEGGGALPAGAATIHIHLPSQVATPRAVRSYDIDSEALVIEPAQALVEAVSNGG